MDRNTLRFSSGCWCGRVFIIILCWLLQVATGKDFSNENLRPFASLYSWCQQKEIVFTSLNVAEESISHLSSLSSITPNIFGSIFRISYFFSPSEWCQYECHFFSGAIWLFRLFFLSLYLYPALCVTISLSLTLFFSLCVKIMICCGIHGFIHSIWCIELLSWISAWAPHY